MSPILSRGNNKSDDSHKWNILYHNQVVKKDIPRLSKTESLKVQRAIENKLSVNPILYGLPLRGTFEQFWKLRVGNWRIVYTVENYQVFILVIANRKEVYRIAKRRS